MNTRNKLLEEIDLANPTSFEPISANYKVLVPPASSNLLSDAPSFLITLPVTYGSEADDWFVFYRKEERMIIEEAGGTNTL